MPDARTVQLLRELIDSPRNRCFACSPHNPIGLHLNVTYENRVARTVFVPGRWHVGWEGVVHGGILATVLDEVMAYALYLEGIKGVTARMDVRFRAPIREDDPLIIEASITRDSRRLVDVEGKILRDGTVVAESHGRFVKLGTLDEDVFD